MSLSDDIIWGAGPIAAFIGVKTPRVYYWARLREAGEAGPPIHKERTLVWARRSELTSHFGGETAR